MNGSTIDAAGLDPMSFGGDIDWNDTAVRMHFIRLARVAQATASAVIITDTAGVTVWVNDGFTRITGYGLDEVVGRIPGHFLQGPDTDRQEVARIGAAVRARQSVAAELVNYAKDGRRYWIGMRIEPIFAANGELDGFMAIEADITERLEERAAIEQAKRRFDIATRAARVGVFERDANFEVVWWNDMMWELFGRHPATSYPCNETWLGWVHPEDRERVREYVAQLAQGRPAIDLQYRIIKPDGQMRHLRSLGAAATHGAVKSLGGVTLDITERVQAQEREKVLQQQLREHSHQAGMAEIATGVLHNVGNVLNSLGIANTTAKRELRNLRLDRLEQATALLHSNRTNLAGFLNEDERGRHLPDYLPALSAQIVSNSRVVQVELDTTERLLSHLINIISAQQELADIGGRHEWVCLNELVETAMLVEEVELAQIEVVRKYEQLPPILTDRHKVLQILVNLLSNASDALKAAAGGSRRIVVKLTCDETHVFATIEDSGVGMSEEVVSQLWQFGFTTKKKGHGFGLHNSANAAHEIGATLTAHSDGIGNGSRFVLRLPIDNPEPMLSGVAA